MHLSDEQCNRFFDTMDSLLTYVNDKFAVVENLDFDEESVFGDAKISLVAKELWNNTDIIDEFIDENPYGLPASHLKTAAAWKNALPGYFTLVRYQSGCAILMNEVGVFEVAGVTAEISDQIGPAPAYVDLTLIPFDDCIVYDGFLMAYDIEQGSRESRSVQDAFEERLKEGIAVTADEFARVVGAWRERQREDELNKFLEDIERESAEGAGEEKLPQGYHRGALAGLSEDQRAAAVKARDDQEAQGGVSDDSKRWYNSSVALKGEPSASLVDCLMLLKRSDLDQIADELHLPVSRTARKAQVADAIARDLPQSNALLSSVLITAAGNAYEALQRALKQGSITFPAAKLAENYNVWPLEPYSYVVRHDNVYTYVIPRETRALLETVDLAEISRLRDQRTAALACVEACVVYCGVVSLDAVYGEYQRLYFDPMSQDDFETVLFHEASYGDRGYDIWMHDSAPYAVHFTLTRDYVASQVMQQSRGFFADLRRNGELDELEVSLSDPATVLGDARTRMQSSFDGLEDLLAALVSAHKDVPMRPLEGDLLTGNMDDALFNDPSVIGLRNYLDAHVPDGEDDYRYADRMVEQVVASSIEVGEVHDMMAIADAAGLMSCTNDPDRLQSLLTNVFSAMPSWDSNGWSMRELYEKMTGRKVFFNEKGEPMKVGRDDPCPCGSGKKYRDCHGR